MTMKEQAYRAHAFLRAAGITSLTRSHIHELLAAAVGFASHAAFQHNATWCDTTCVVAGLQPSSELLHARCLELGLTLDESGRVTNALIKFQLDQGYAAVRFDELVAAVDIFEEDPSWQQWVSTEIMEPGRRDVCSYFEHQPVLLQGLEAAAARGVAAAHFAIAKLLEGEAEMYPAEEERFKRHFRRAGVWQTEFVSFAEVGADPLRAEEKYRHHLFEAARSGDLRALIESAERFSDPAILDHMPSEAIDPMSMVHLASEHEDDTKLRFWLTAAAQEGNISAMRELILGHDEPLERAWVWMHLSRLIGHDLSQNHYRLVHENGDRYDDDVGGPGYAVGDDGIELEPLNDVADAAATEEAERLFNLIEAQQER